MKIDALHEVKQTVTPVIYRHLYSLYIQPVKVIYYDEAQGVCLLGGVASLWASHCYANTTEEFFFAAIF
jgi:hypothetical protein